MVNLIGWSVYLNFILSSQNLTFLFLFTHKHILQRTYFDSIWFPIHCLFLDLKSNVLVMKVVCSLSGVYIYILECFSKYILGYAVSVFILV